MLKYIIIIFVICGFLIYINNNIYSTKYEISSVDNRKYLVRNESDSKDAADLLATVRKLLITLINKLNEENNSPYWQTILNKFKNNLSETSFKKDYTSYSVNKGEKIYLCLRSKVDNSLIDLNTLMFVALHEFAHMITKDLGHTPQFWKNFEYLINKAVKYKLYTKVDYKSNPKKYCGIIIKSNP